MDGLGNWANYLEKTSGTTTLDQDRAHNAVNEIGTIGVTTGANWIDPVHDAAGNMTEAPKPGAETTKHKYIWDAWNRLVKVTDSAGTTTIAEFAYDGFHRRIAKKVGSNTTHYYLSQQDQVLEEYLQVGNGSPTVRNAFVWHPHYVDALAVYYDNSGDGHFALEDANHNLTAVLDDTAAVEERCHYTPYGQPTFLNASFTSPNTTSTLGLEVLFTGRQFDAETGLFYYRARYYHPTLGRFLGRDPISYAGGDANIYRYVGGNPLNRIDPSGKFWGIGFSAIGAVIGATVSVVATTVITVATTGRPPTAGQIAGAAVSGAISGGIIGAVASGDVATGIAVGAVGGALGGGAGSIVQQGIDNGSVDMGQVAVSATIGGVTGAVSGGLGSTLPPASTGGAVQIAGVGTVNNTVVIATGQEVAAGINGAVTSLGQAAVNSQGQVLVYSTGSGGDGSSSGSDDEDPCPDRTMSQEEAIENGLTERDPNWPWRGLHETEGHHPLMQGDSFRQF